MPGSDLRRRSRNGPISSWNCARLAGSTRRTRSARPTPCGTRCGCRAGPGVAQSRIAHSSVRLFSTGVPVSATRARLGIDRSARAVEERAFLTCWASSATTRSQRASASAACVAPHRAVGGEHEARGRHRPASAGRRGSGGPARPARTGGSRPPSCRAARPGRPRGSGAVAPASIAVQVEGDQGDRLAEAHVVGQAGAEPERGQLGQPGEARAAGSRAASPAAPPAARSARGSAAVAELVAHLQQRGADDDRDVLLGAVALGVDLHHAGQRRGHGLRRA